jgi:hypothetical protein
MRFRGSTTFFAETGPTEEGLVALAITTTPAALDMLTEWSGTVSDYVTFVSNVDTFIQFGADTTASGGSAFLAAKRQTRVRIRGARYVLAAAVTGSGILRAWPSTVRIEMGVAVAVTPPPVEIDFAASFSMTMGFSGTLDDAVPQDFTAAFHMSMGFEPSNLDAGVVLPNWTTASVTAVAYAADHPNLTALSSGAVVSIAIPPIIGTGGSFQESTIGGNHVTYHPTQLDGQPTLIFDGAAGGGLTYSGSSAPVSYRTGNDAPGTEIVRGRFTALGSTGHLFGFGNSGNQDPFLHAGVTAGSLWQNRKRNAASGGGSGPQAGTANTTVHTVVTAATGTTADQYVDATQTANNVAQDETSLTFDRASLATLHRNTTTPAGAPMEGRRWIFADKFLNSTDIALGRLWAETSAVYATLVKFRIIWLGSSSAQGFNLAPGEAVAERLVTDYGIELFDYAVNGNTTSQTRATGSANTDFPGQPAVNTSNNVTAALTACPNPNLAMYWMLTDTGPTGYDAYLLAGYTGTWEQYFDTYAIPYAQEALTALEAAGAETIIMLSAQPSDQPTSGAFPLATYTARRDYADTRCRAVFGLKYWDRLRTRLLDVDGTVINALVQADGQHPTAAANALFETDFINHVRERCPRAAPWFV